MLFPSFTDPATRILRKFQRAIAAFSRQAPEALVEFHDFAAEVAATIPPHVVPRVLERVQELRHEQAITAVREKLFTCWAAHNGHAAAEQAIRVKDGDRESVVQEVVKVWAHHDPESSLDWIMALSEQPVREFAATSWIQAVAQIEPTRAWQAYRSGVLRVGPGALIALCERLPDLDLAWDLALTLRVDGRSSASGVLIVLRRLLRNSTEAALSRWGQVPPEMISGRVGLEFAEALVRKNPTIAVEFAEAQMRPPEKIKALANAFAPWLQRDAEAALQWFHAQNTTLQAEVYREAFGSMTIFAPEIAIQFLLFRGIEGVRAERLEDFVWERYRIAPNGTLDWCARIAGEWGQAICCKRGAGLYGRDDFEAAVEWCMELPAGVVRAQACRGVARAGYYSNHPAFRKWLNELPPELSDEVHAEIGLWESVEGIQKASAWLQHVQSPQLRDQTWSQIAVAPHAALKDGMKFASRIEDQDLRETTLEEVVRVRFDPGCRKSREVIVRSKLPERIKARLLNQAVE